MLNNWLNLHTVVSGKNASTISHFVHLGQQPRQPAQQPLYSVTGRSQQHKNFSVTEHCTMRVWPYFDGCISRFMMSALILSPTHLYISTSSAVAASRTCHNARSQHFKWNTINIVNCNHTSFDVILKREYHILEHLHLRAACKWRATSSTARTIWHQIYTHTHTHTYAILITTSQQ